MNDVFLLIDVSNLMHRALHTTGGLVHPKNAKQFTGCLYGLWKTCDALHHTFSTENLCFFFDSRHKTNRQQLLPEYKAHREMIHNMEDPVMHERRSGMYAQIGELLQLLHKMECDNIHCAKFYEADDLIASACKHNIQKKIIVSSDSDLWQLLGTAVSCYSPTTNKMTTEASFRQKYGIAPKDWAKAKAWTGDTSDNIPGIKGVGPATAVQYISGKLNPESKKYRLFEEAENIVKYERNLKLIELPWETTPAIQLTAQRIPLNWKVVADHIGSYSIESIGLKK